MKLRFLGSTACIPDIDEDTPCFLVNNKVLFDCGWNCIEGIRKFGCNPKEIECLVFTHMHHDHFLGLPQLLFYYIQSRSKDLSSLTIAGPAETVQRVVDDAFRFIQMEDIARPKIIKLHPGDSFECSGMSFETMKSHHPVPGLCYRITEIETGKVLAASGDTAYTGDTMELYKGASALIHEATIGLAPASEPADVRACGHSTLLEAVAAANDADIPILFPMHCAVNRIIRESMTVKTDVNIVPPKRGLEYVI